MDAQAIKALETARNERIQVGPGIYCPPRIARRVVVTHVEPSCPELPSTRLPMTRLPMTRLALSARAPVAGESRRCHQRVRG